MRVRAGYVVVIGAFDDVPEHEFLVEEVLEDCVTSVALPGPLAGNYGEPSVEMILRVVRPHRTYHSQQDRIIKKIGRRLDRLGAVVPRAQQ